MPYSITTKDGITIQNIPDDVAPDSQSLKDRVAAIRAGGGQSALAPPGFAERLGAGAKESVAGMMQLAGRALPVPGNVAAGVDTAATNAIQNAERLSSQTEGLDIARLLGNALVTAPLAAIGGAPTTLGRAAIAGGLQGAAQGAIAPVDTSQGQDYATAKAQQIGVGGLAGAIATPIGMAGLKLIGNAALRGYQSLASKVKSPPSIAEIEQAVSAAVGKQGVDWQALDADVKQTILSEVQAAGRGATELNPEVLANRATLKQAGVQRPTTAQETQSPADFGREKSLAAGPEGAALAAQRQQVYEDLNKGLRDVTGKAPAALDRESAGIVAQAPVIQRANKLKARVDKLYDIARNAAGRDQVIPASDLANRVYPQLDQAAILTDLPPGLARFMEQIQDPANPPVTIARAEEVLRTANDAFGKADRAGDGAAKRAIGIFKTELNKSLDDAVVASGDARALTALRSAQKAAAARFQELESVPALKAVSDGDLTPDFFMQKFVTGPRVDNGQLRTLKNFYQKRDPAAWAQVRGQVLDDLYQKASSGSEKQFNLATYNKELAKIMATGRAKVLFEPDELAQLETIGKAAKLVQGPQAQPPPTGLTGAAYAADRLGKIIKSLGTLKGVGLIVEPIANFAAGAPRRAAVGAAMQGATAASRPTVTIPQPLADRLQRGAAAGLGISAAAPFIQQSGQ